METPTLHHDALRLIADRTPPHAAIPLSQTCRLLHDRARRLWEAPITPSEVEEYLLDCAHLGLTVSISFLARDLSYLVYACLAPQGEVWRLTMYLGDTRDILHDADYEVEDERDYTTREVVDVGFGVYARGGTSSRSETPSALTPVFITPRITDHIIRRRAGCASNWGLLHVSRDLLELKGALKGATDRHLISRALFLLGDHEANEPHEPVRVRADEAGRWASLLMSRIEYMRMEYSVVPRRAHA